VHSMSPQCNRFYYQALSGRIKQEHRDIVGRNYVGQKGGEAVENCIDRGLRSDGARNLKARGTLLGHH
jgi:hypothetical protein